MWQFAVMNMQGTKLGTTVQGGNGLAGVQQLFGVKRLLHGMKLLQFGGVELHAHLVDFLQANAVFTGDGATHGNAQLKNFPAQLLGTFQFPGLVGIIEDQWMEVAIARVKDIADGQAVCV